MRELRGANIRSLMVTGDNLLTAIAVARDCEMLPESAPVFVVSVDTSCTPPKIVFRREGRTGIISLVDTGSGESDLEQMEQVSPPTFNHNSGA